MHFASFNRGFKLREDMDGLEEVVQALDFVCSDGLVLPAYEDDDPSKVTCADLSRSGF